MSAQAASQDYEVKAGLEELDGFDVVGLSRLITSGADGAAEEINQLWQDFFQMQIAHHLPERLDDVIYAVYSNYEGDHTKSYRLTLGYRMKEKWVNDGNNLGTLKHVSVQNGSYALMSAAGEQPKALTETWTAIWQSDLDRSFKTDFEVYGQRFFEEGVHEVLVAVGVNIK
ncbi:MAG: GyrI-like domain-containing protein [Alphaproteobacteria bacterium]|nr:GyrI-like domain-containing protein [Alphaproteobacteria bacterium]